LVFNHDQANDIYRRISSILSNILVRTAYMLKNMVNKIKIMPPVNLNEIFLRYTVIERQFDENGNENSPKKSSPNEE
jgi:hypothetical protein